MISKAIRIIGMIKIEMFILLKKAANKTKRIEAKNQKKKKKTNLKSALKR